MENLGLILTGQIRSFFSEITFNNFLFFLINLKNKYNIYMILVINEKEIDISKFIFLKDYVINYEIINYYYMEKRKINYKFDKIISYEKSNNIYNIRKNEISNENEYLERMSNQIEQIKIGINELNKYNNINIYMRTRFDVIYNLDLIPFVTNDILFPHSHQQLDIHNNILKTNFNNNYNNMILYLKQNPIYINDIRLNDTSKYIGFGGAYYNNTCFLNNNPKLWMYNDHIIIGYKKEFNILLYFWSLFNNEDDLLNLIKISNIKHIFAPESLIILLCLKYNITPIMYLDNLWDLRRNS